MKITDIIRRAGRSLKQAKIRTLLTSMAIGVGAFTLTLALAAGEGSRQYTEKLISTNIDKDSIAVSKDPSLFGAGQQRSGPQEYDPDATSLGLTQGGGSVKRINQDDLEKIQSTEGVDIADPLYDVAIKYFYPKENPEDKFVATVTQYDSTILTETTAGTLPPLRTDIQNDQITVPDSYVKSLGYDNAQDAIGKEIVLYLERPANIDPDEIEELFKTGGPEALQNLQTTVNKEVTLKIVATTNVSTLSFQGEDTMTVSAETAKELSEFLTEGTDNYQKYLLVGVVADSGADVVDVKKRLEDQGFTARTAEDLQEFLFQIVNVLQGIVGGFGVLALIASVFGIINTQYISVLERTQQIGLMKALGMRRRDVSRLFRLEAAWIGFLGGVIGSTLAVVTGTILNPFITKQLSLGEGTNLLIFQPIPIAGLIILLIVVAITAGYFPAKKAAKLDPIEALRTE